MPPRLTERLLFMSESVGSAICHRVPGGQAGPFVTGSP